MRILYALFLAAALLAAQSSASKKARDLKVEADPFPEGESQLLTRKVDIPRSYAIIMGVGAYQNLPKDLHLAYSERDADSLYSILISLEGGNYRAENVKKLLGPRATLANLKQEIEEWLPRVAKENDRVFIYFAGHGFIHQGKGYLAPYDFNLNDVAGTGYPMESLAKTVGQKVKAKWKVMMTDSCHSGFVNTETRADSLNSMIQNLDKSMFSLTASRDQERSFESADFGGGHGVFTYYVVKGMEGEADDDRDGIVTASEMTEYVRKNVREATKGKQTPRSDRGSFDPEMLIAYVPSYATAAPPPAPKFGTLVFETNREEVEVFVDGKSAGIATKTAPLRLPGLRPGAHQIQGIKMGYEPDGPREEMVYPGQETTVKIQILIPRKRPKAAVEQFDKGLEFYNKGFEQNYRKAAEHLAQALTLDPTYSQAALYLGRANNALFDQTKARQYFELAIRIDPDYSEARSSFGGMLLDVGDIDGSIRQFDTVLKRNPKDVQTLYLRAQAFRIKERYDDAIESAKSAIAISPTVAEPHFWLAESLRMNGSYKESRKEYVDYLKYSNFDSGLSGNLNYYVVGFLVGHGKRRRAAQKDIWQDLRSLAYFGLCDCAYRDKKLDDAALFCQKSLQYDSEYPYAHYLTGLVFATQAQASGSLETLSAARKHFERMLILNPDMDEAKNVKAMLRSFNQALAATR
ncbi:tetratricopeptide repeat protein [Bryobacter aggregatus]|uniref:tetratricopeptide repeat protein n=1 Tax=Bryobacter aggregatus TaxID=360054 RepID=UPI0004E1652C|nr:tetratricopeptide repeat protein [Bryobacter aggregatus]